MYEERRDSFSLRDIILQILFVALFIFILMWLFPTKKFVTNYVDSTIEDAVKNALGDYEFGGGINSEAFANQLFNQNVMMMKNSAKDYFTLSRLPEKNGDQVKITLKQMLDEKIILPFVDSKGKACDTEASYVLVTKTDTEYLMKVNLKCSDYEDYLMVHMGCYDYCSTTICESKTPSNPSKGGDDENPTPTPTPTPTVFEYEYQLVIDGKWGEFGEWSEWTKNIISKTEYNEVETKIEKEIEKYIKIADGSEIENIPAEMEVKLSCPTGFTLSGDICIRTSDVSESINATASTTYTCPDSSYTLSGTKCVKTIGSNNSIQATVSTTYTCPNGYARNGNMCYRYYNSNEQIAATTNTTYNCPDSTYYLSGSQCYKKVTIPATSRTTYTCPNSSYELQGNKCVKSSSSTINATKSYTCPNGYNKSKTDNTKCYTSVPVTVNATASTSYTSWQYAYQTTSNYALTSTNTTKYVLAGTKVNSSCGNPCTNKYTYTYNVYTRKQVTKYSCPNSSYELQGNKCVKSSSSTINATKSYTCPNGYNKSKTDNTKCYTSVPVTVNATASTTYSCPTGYDRSGNTCSRLMNTPATARVSSYCPDGYSLINTYTCVKVAQDTEVISATASTTYTCPSGYTRNGSTCYTSSNSIYTTEAIAKTTYTCPDSSYTLSGNKCIKTQNTTERAFPLRDSTYTCPDGYTQDGSRCIKIYTRYREEAIYREVTYYRSRTRSYISGSVDYKWSRSQNDITLIKQGYKLTGKSREVK